ncbi:MAG: RDD family protein [Planctomycetes bacterium]|nr:RDD family protein [Planctomycetota bacterium]
MNDSPGYLRKRRRATAALFFCLVLLLLSLLALQEVEDFKEPVALPLGEKVYLFYRGLGADDEGGIFYRMCVGVRPEAEGVAPLQLHGEFSTAVAIGQDLWVFLPGTVSVHRPGKAPMSRKWAEAWTPLAALPAPERAGKAWVVGAAGGTLVAREGEAGGEWAPLPSGPRRARSLTSMRAIPVGVSAVVVWREEGPEDAEGDLFWSRFSRAGWGPVGVVHTGSSLTGFAPVAIGEQVRVFLSAEDAWDLGRVRLAVADLDAGSNALRNFHLADPHFLPRGVSGIATCARGDKLELYLTRIGEVSVARLEPSRVLGEVAAAGGVGAGGGAGAGGSTRGGTVDAGASVPTGAWGELTGLGHAAHLTKAQIWAYGILLLFLSVLLVAIGVALLRERLRPSTQPAPSLPEDAYASPLQRGLAYGLDLLLLAPAYALLTSIAGGGTPADQQQMIEDGRIFWVLLGCHFLTLVYFILCEGRFGQTVGKWSVGIEVVRLDGSRISWFQSIFRNLVRCLDGMDLRVLLGLLFLLSTERSQRLGDLAARTIVLRRRGIPFADRDPGSGAG